MDRTVSPLFSFGTKAETLLRLRDGLTKSAVGELVACSAGE